MKAITAIILTLFWGVWLVCLYSYITGQLGHAHLWHVLGLGMIAIAMTAIVRQER